MSANPSHEDNDNVSSSSDNGAEEDCSSVSDAEEADILSFRLNDATQYHAVLTSSIQEIMDNVALLLLEHVQLVNKQLLPRLWGGGGKKGIGGVCGGGSSSTVTTSPAVLCFVIDRGLATALHVFQGILTHTRNLTMATQYALQANFLYTEYVRYIYKNQLTERLTSYDAVQYVYKRTLYTLRVDFVLAAEEAAGAAGAAAAYARESEREHDLFAQVATWSQTYCNLILFLYTHWTPVFRHQPAAVSDMCCQLLRKLIETLNTSLVSPDITATTTTAWAQCLNELLHLLLPPTPARKEEKEEKTENSRLPSPQHQAPSIPALTSPIAFLEHMNTFVHKLVAKPNRTPDQYQTILRKMRAAVELPTPTI